MNARHFADLKRAARFVAESLEGRLLLAAVTNSQIDFGGSAQHLAYSFNSSVGSSDLLASLSLMDLLQNQVVTDTLMAVTSDMRNTASVAWPDYTSASAPNGVLPDGHYESIIEDGTGSVFTSENFLPFYVYRGDADGDRDVDFGDLTVLTQHYNTAGTYSQGDFNYDGTINFADLTILSQKYGSPPCLPAPTHLPWAPTPPARSA